MWFNGYGSANTWEMQDRSNMKIKLKDKNNPIIKKWCFNSNGYESSIIEKLNSGKQVVVQKVPKPAWDFVEEVKKQVKKKKENE